MIINEEDYLAHYGVKRRSGRYAWGSGGNAEKQRDRTFLDEVALMRKQGLKDTDIVKGMGLDSTTQLRAKYTIALAEQKQAEIAMARKLKDKGYSNGAIAERMGKPGESSIRALLADDAADKAAILTSTSDMLKRQVEEKQFIDVGAGNENYLGISKEKLGAAVAVLQEQGYEVHTIPVPQIGTGKDTKVKVLAPPGTTWGDVKRNQDNIKTITEFSDDSGRHYGKVHDAIPVDPKRVAIRYAEDGGKDADGVIYVREGVPDVSLGANRYAQVRVQVGKDHYLKGMAMYKDDLPPGTDLVFNTNKSKKDAPTKLDVMKKISDNDPSLPYGAVVRQILADKGTDAERNTSAMNIVNEQGQWAGWSKSLSTQFLSKQSPALAKQQLNKSFERREKDLQEIVALTNPTVRKKLLDTFADDADSAAVHLEAAALSQRQAWHVILPVDSMKPGEVYAPNYNNGERVALVRYPHGGTFELPDLVVNNKNREARRLLGNAEDAVGIHKSVAERLSGADFDGDTVVVIPNNQRKIRSTAALAQLKGFDPQREYPKYEGMKTMSSSVKQQEMGNVSNLITDMTIAGASHDKIARAVKHSMVVIDAQKHELNWKQSAIDNNIAALKQEYQGSARSGASTLISRATSEARVPDRKPRSQKEGGPVNRETGQLEWTPTGKVNQSGKPKMIKSTKLAETHDAHTLVSKAGTPMERHYAEHSNKLKAMANQARLESLKTPPLKYSPSANKTYKPQVDRLLSALAIAERNAPRERQAQIVANAQVRMKRQANPNLEGDTLKKIRIAALNDARARMGAGKQRIVIEPKEWDAIQAGAISNHRLEQILRHSDLDRVRELATPRTRLKMTSSKTTQAKALLAAGYTRAEVASKLGVSLTTLDTSMSGEGAYD